MSALATEDTPTSTDAAPGARVARLSYFFPAHNEEANHELVAFTDGDRQFQVADLGRLTARLQEADHPDVVVGFRIKRADPLVRTVYARAYRLANRIFFGLRVTDVDCA